MKVKELREVLSLLDDDSEVVILKPGMLRIGQGQYCEEAAPIAGTSVQAAISSPNLAVWRIVGDGEGHLLAFSESVLVLTPMRPGDGRAR